MRNVSLCGVLLSCAGRSAGAFLVYGTWRFGNMRTSLFCAKVSAFLSGGQDALCRSEIRSFFGGIGRVWREAGNIPEQAMNWGDGLFLGQNCRKCAPLLHRRPGPVPGLRANRLGHTRRRGGGGPRRGVRGGGGRRGVVGGGWGGRRVPPPGGGPGPRRPRRSC